MLEGEERAVAERFAAQEREHAGALMTMTLALTLEVRRHAVGKDLDNLMPGFEALGRRETLEALLELETAAVAGQQALARDMVDLDTLRTVGHGHGRRRAAPRRPAAACSMRSRTRSVFENG